MKIQLLTTLPKKISQRKLVKGYPCLTQNDDGTIGLNIAGPKSNYKSKSKLEIWKNLLIEKKYAAKLLNGFLIGSVLFGTWYVSTFVYINRSGIYESFISLIPIIQTNDEKKATLANSTPKIHNVKTQTEEIKPLPIPAPLGNNTKKLPPTILPPPSLAPQMSLVKPNIQEKSTTETAINVVLNKSIQHVTETVKTNEITVGVMKKPQWIAITINDDQLVMTNNGETAQFPVGQTLPSGEVLKTIDSQKNQYSTNLSTHSIKGDK